MEKNKEKKEIRISLKQWFIIVCLVIITSVVVIRFSIQKDNGGNEDISYQKVSYSDVHMNDNIGNIISGEYEIVKDFEDYKNILNIIKDFNHSSGTNAKYNSKFFNDKNLLVIDCCGIGNPNFYTELQSVSEKNNIVNVKLYWEYSGLTADARGDVYFIPISKNITQASIKHKENNTTPQGVALKPIIYLYPESELNLKVSLSNPEKITCSYPKYIDSWNVLAKPNGDLVDLDTNRNLYALYYESENIVDFKVEREGFCIKGEDSAKFLEEKLEMLGLNEREAEEFIVYWLPKLEANKYNYIRFATMEEINNNMNLKISSNPDTIIRVLMTYKGLEKSIEVKEQKIVTPERQGFVLVEWGGTEIN